MAVYPTALVTTANIANAGANLSTNPHSDLHDDMRDEIVAIEAELGIAPSSSYATVAARLNAGWQHIAEAAVSGATSFSIPVPASTYKRLNLVIWGTIAVGTEALQCRVNGDSTAALHETVGAQIFSDTVNTNVFQSTSYQVGTVGTLASNINVDFYDADVSQRLPFQGRGVVYAVTEANLRSTTFGGRLAANRLVSSLLIFPGASTFTGSYILSGYRIP